MRSMAIARNLPEMEKRITELEALIRQLMNEKCDPVRLIFRLFSSSYICLHESFDRKEALYC
jgi:hypothetical protein